MTGPSELSSPTAQHNRAAILNAIRSRAPVSRTQLRETTGIRLATITDLVRGLLDEGILVEAGTGGTGRGRKRILLRLNPAHAYAVGVEFDADHVIGVVLDFEMKPVAVDEAPLDVTCGKDAVIEQLKNCVARVLAEAEIEPDRLLGIGIADPGVVDPEAGVAILSSTIKDWRQIPLVSIFEQAFSVPALLEENTRARTLAEHRFGAGRAVSHMMFVEVGPGIGCGIVTPQGLYRGARGAACELGHTRVADLHHECRCGSCGCLETVASLPAIAARAVEALEAGAASSLSAACEGVLSKLKADHVFEAARQGDKLSLRLIDETCGYLGLGIANAVNLFNPEMIVLDPRLAPVEDLILRPIRDVVLRQALQVATENLEFRVSNLGPENGALGVASMVVDKAFEVPRLSLPELV